MPEINRYHDQPTNTCRVKRQKQTHCLLNYQSHRYQKVENKLHLCKARKINEVKRKQLQSQAE